MFKNFFQARRLGRQEEPEFDPVLYDAAIRSSICTGEKTAGFVDKKTGHFTDVMLIRTQKDLEKFKETYGVTEVKTIY